MELDVSNYYVHCIYYMADMRTFYLRASPSVVETVKAIRLNEGNPATFYGYEATWLGTAQLNIGTLGTTISAYESYYVGSVN